MRLFLLNGHRVLEVARRKWEQVSVAAERFWEPRQGIKSLLQYST